MKYRIRFCKFSAMIYIGHLDIMRYFQKAMRRAELPIAYSEGFSPHQIMSFAQPLGVGLYSNGEYLDVQFTETVNTDAIKDKLENVMAEGIHIASVVALPEDAGNAMASIASAKYTVKTTDIVNGLDVVFEDFLKQESIIFEKTTKKGSRLINLKDGIFDTNILSDDTIELMLDCSSSGNIKPSQVMSAFCTFQNISFDPYKFHYVRDDMYTRDSSNAFLSLEDVGYQIHES